MKRCIKLLITFILVLGIDVYLVNFNLQARFKDLTIELGTESVNINSFVVSEWYAKKAKFLTDLKAIDFGVAGEYDVILSHGNKEEKVKLNIVDTTPPKVDFTDLKKGLDYKIVASDFVTLVKDKSAYTIATDEREITTPGDYKVLITVSDEFGNKTSKECNLNISVYKPLINHELGETLTKEAFLTSSEYGEAAITSDILKKVDVFKEGEYLVSINFMNTEYQTKVIVKDTKGPDVKVNNIDFYIGGQPKKNEDFVKSIKDPSGVKEVIYEGKLDFTKIGTYDLKIKATDNLGNVTETVAKLNVKDDKIGPTFSGIKTISINKNQEIDYYTGIKARDAKDGVREFSVDASKVDTSKAGTYYAIYTSKDESNNVTTVKRKVIVSYDMEDLERMARAYYDKYLAGKSVLQMTKYIHDNNGYSHTYGSDLDALYQILTKKSGSCRGHAFLLEKALNYAGYKNMVIKTTDGTHYWNLVYENGKWRHYDSTGGHDRGPDTDKQKLASSGMHGRKWDFSAYPEAN